WLRTQRRRLKAAEVCGSQFVRPQSRAQRRGHPEAGGAQKSPMNATAPSPKPPRRSRRIGLFFLIAALLISIVLFVLVQPRAKYSPPSAGLVAWWRAEGNANDS